MNHPLDEERVERAAMTIRATRGLYGKPTPSSLEVARAAISAYLGETHVVVPRVLTEREHRIVVDNGYVGDFSNLESDWSLLLAAVSPPFNVNTGDSEETPLTMRDRK